jgi:geranylgeranyl pyrophosphate synthase/thiamine phosphate synthase YjbQ (UPF0047 family)
MLADGALLLDECGRLRAMRGMPALPDPVVDRYRQLAQDVARPDTDWGVAAKSVVIAALIQRSTECHRLIADAACSLIELLEGDLHLAAAGRIAPLLNRHDLEREFSQILMAASLAQEYEARLEGAVVRSTAPPPDDQRSASTGRDEQPPAWNAISVEAVFRTGSRVEEVDLTERLQRCVTIAGVTEGRLHLFPLHATPAPIGRLDSDCSPQAGDYSGHGAGFDFACRDGDRARPEAEPGRGQPSVSQLRAMVTVPVLDSRLLLGRGQRLCLVELDGPGCRRVLIQVEGRVERDGGLDCGTGLERHIVHAWAQDPAKVRLPMGSLLLAGGKRLRPQLAILASRLGPAYDPVRSAALGTAVELVHNASMVHDDIADDSATRRGGPTVHRVYGIATAVRVGVFYFARAYSLLADLHDPDVTRTVMEAVAALSRGQVAEYHNRGRLDLSEAEYLRTARNKTAALIAASCTAGAALAGAPAATVAAARRYGEALGIAFQIVDDVLDFGQTTGKPMIQDISQSVVSLPLVYALQDAVEGGRIREALGRRDAESAARVLQMVLRTSALDRSMARARDLRDRAIRHLAALPEGRVRDQLHDVAARMLERTA